MNQLSITSLDAYLASQSDDILLLEPLDDQLLFQDADDLLATITTKKIPMTGAQRRDRYRQRQHNHRQELKEQIARLTQQMEALRKGDGSNEVALSMAKRSNSTWRLIAMKEKHNRISAEALQKKLRLAVANQAAMIIDLEHIIYKRVCRGRANNCDYLLSLTETRPRFGPKNGVVLDSFMGELNIAYRETDTILNSCVSDTGSGEFHAVYGNSGEVDYFHLSDTIQLPFEYQRVSDLIWEVVSLPHRQMERKLYSSLMTSKNEFAVMFCVVCPREVGGDVIVTTYFVARQYIEDERVVVVWRGLMEGDGDFAGIRMEETGWCVGYPVPSDTSQADSTFVRKYARVVPMHFGTSTAKVVEFSKLILRSLLEVNTTIAAYVGKLVQGRPDHVETVVTF